MKNNNYYIYTLKVEGRNEKILPILDFKYDSAKLEKLLSGETLTLDHDYYIAMGDNTKNSLDSRYWGYVQDNRIKGKILVRFWPLYKFGLIK
jgi:signal peptidase I